MESLGSAPWPRACLQVYTGDGKGKTTAAFGLALRAAGRGIDVFVGQFMKGSDYGELPAARALGGRVTVEQFGAPDCIPWRERPAARDVELARAGIARCREVLVAGCHRIVVLDEVNVAVHFRLISERDLLDLVDARPADVELLCTGRNAPAALLERADLITEMREVRHPYASARLLARDGIER